MLPANKGKELIKNTGILAIGNMATKALTFFLLPLYTTLLTKEEYGVIEILTTYVALLIPIVNCQISQAVFRFATENRKSANVLTKIFTSSFYVSVLLFLLYTVLFLILYNLISLPYKWYLLIGVFLNVAMQMVSYAARGIGDNIAYSAGSFLFASSIIILNVIFLVVFKMGIYGMFLAYCIGPVIGIAYVILKIRLWRYIKWHEFCVETVKEQLCYAMPLVPNELSWWILNVSNKVIVNHFLGFAATGVFGVAAKFSAIFSTVFSIFNASWTEQVVLHFNDSDGKEFIQDIFDRGLRFFIAMNLMTIASMPFVYPVFVNASYIEGYSLVPLLLISCIGQVFVGLVSPIYLVNNETRKIAEATVCAGFINVLSNILLIRYIGIYSACIASILGYATVAIIRVIDIEKRYFSLNLNKKILVSSVLTYMVIIGFYYYNKGIANVLCWVGCLLYCFYINKKNLLPMYRMLKTKISKGI